MSYSNINRVVLVGRLTADPELRALPSGTTVCNLRMACNGVARTPTASTPRSPTSSTSASSALRASRSIAT